MISQSRVNERVLLLTDVFELFELDVLALLSDAAQLLNQLHWERERQENLFSHFFVIKEQPFLSVFHLLEWTFHTWAVLVYLSRRHLLFHTTNRTCAPAAQSQLQFINLCFFFNYRRRYERNCIYSPSGLIMSFQEKFKKSNKSAF